MESNRSQQKDEMELLHSIFIDNMHTHNSDPFHSFEIALVPDVDINGDEYNISALFEVDFHEDYPSDKVFKFKITDVNNRIVESQFKPLNSKIEELFEENKGFPIVYQATEIIKEFINELEVKMHETNSKKESVKVNVVNSKNTGDNSNLANTLNTLSLIETRKFTPVTKESYNEWFEKFMKEKAAEEAKEAKKLKERKEINSRLSGREFFMNAIKDKNSTDLLNEEYNKDDGEDVDYKPNDKENIDENLFQEEDIDFNQIDFDDENIDA